MVELTFRISGAEENIIENIIEELLKEFSFIEIDFSIGMITISIPFDEDYNSVACSAFNLLAYENIDRISYERF
jgi:hypothetical protein